MATNFLDAILTQDKALLIYLNNLGNEQWDSFWLAITKQLNWIPLYVFVIVLIFYKLKLKKGLFTVLFLIVLVVFSDQFTNLVKHLVGRIRPCNVAELQQYLRQFTYRPQGFSFWSGHAFTSTSFSVFVVFLLKKHVKWSYLFLLFPLLFGYSRIYLRVHYPLDVCSGYVMGAVFGYVLFIGYTKLHNEFFKDNPN